MASQTSKCVACGQVVPPVKQKAGEVQRCPACGGRVISVAAATSPAAVARVPAPRAPAAPKPAARPAAPSAAVSRRPAAAPRPATPADALAASGAWVPDPEPGPSPDASTARLSPPRRLDIPPQSAAAAQPPDGGGISLGWVALGVAILALIGGIIFLAARSGSRGPVASAPQHDADAAAAPPVASVSPVAPAPPPAVAPAPPGPAVSHVVNLLALIDPARDTITGTWQATADGLASDLTTRAKIGIPYRPPAEYDFRVEFTRTAGNDCVLQMFTDQKPCAWMLSGWHGLASGFHTIDGKSANLNPSTVKDVVIVNGERHVSEVRVRKDAIEAWLDGKLLSTYPTNGSDLGTGKDWEFPDRYLGIGTYKSPAVFHKVELVEITGRGSVIR